MADAADAQTAFRLRNGGGGMTAANINAPPHDILVDAPQGGLYMCFPHQVVLGPSHRLFGM